MISHSLFSLFIAISASFSVKAVDAVNAQSGTGAYQSQNGIELIYFSLSADGPTMVLPKTVTETKEQALRSYVETLRQQGDLSMHVSELSQIDRVIWKSAPTESAMLFVANKVEDQTEKAYRVQNFMNQIPFESKYLLAIAAAERLGLKYRTQFYQQINKTFSSLVVMGGDDVAPELYREQKTHARNFIKIRDMNEIELIKHYYEKSKGFIFGVCRGLQITSVALGYKLYQDVTLDLGTKMEHGTAVHSVDQMQTTNKLLARALGSELPFDVFSYHHQAVRFVPGGPLEVAAVSSDGVVEALEMKNGRGLLVQFHPELRPSIETTQMFNLLATKAKTNRRVFSCEAVFN
jgi:putative glutamine amidotransferase